MPGRRKHEHDASKILLLDRAGLLVSLFLIAFVLVVPEESATKIPEVSLRMEYQCMIAQTLLLITPSIAISHFTEVTLYRCGFTWGRPSRRHDNASESQAPSNRTYIMAMGNDVIRSIKITQYPGHGKNASSLIAANSKGSS